MRFDTVVIIDWSGGNDRGPTPVKDAIWACIAGQEPIYFRNRQLVEEWLIELFETELAAGRRVMAGFDFPFAYPAGFAKAATGSDDPLAMWAWLNDLIEDAPKSNNRFDIAGNLNAKFGGIGPFWGNGLAREIPHLPKKGGMRTNTDFPERRAVETHAKGSFTCWQLAGAGAVGSQVLMGLPVLHRLRERFKDTVSVWPFEAPLNQITFAEVWPSLFTGSVPDGMIKDAHQVKSTAEHLGNTDLADLLDVSAPIEGWILGVPQAKRPTPPLRNDCFAMPQGAYWTPVDDALAHLKSRLTVVTGTKEIALKKANGRILATDIAAQRAHPPTPNSAVDGYGFAGGAPVGEQVFSLVEGRSAAGQPYAGHVAKDQAIRVLTGAALPSGVDTVVLQEDVVIDGNLLRFHGPLKQGANARRAGEDMVVGQGIFDAGHKLRPVDLATLAATGIGEITVRKKLRVGILSTGDELAQAGRSARDDQIYDANRPMLRSVVRAWGHKAIDLGCAPDHREKLRQTVDAAALKCDVILTSGGASAGDEDHMSALLEGTGSFAIWRIAMKPGRPLALGIWNEIPVFGLPGNPVAALICALVFARPSLSLLAGGGWVEPQVFTLPAAFTKSKKAGRREYIRARVEDGKAIAFASEGSGRVSGLSWAEGLVEFGDDAETITPGDTVRFIPYASFGL